MEIVIASVIVAGLAIYLFSRRKEVDEAPGPQSSAAPYKLEQSVVLESVKPVPIVVAGNPLVIEPVQEPVKPAAKQPRQPRKPAAKPAVKTAAKPAAKPAAIQATKKPRTPRAK